MWKRRQDVSPRKRCKALAMKPFLPGLHGQRACWRSATPGHAATTRWTRAMQDPTAELCLWRPSLTATERDPLAMHRLCFCPDAAEQTLP